MTRIYLDAKRISKGLKSTVFSVLIKIYLASQSPKYPKYIRSPIFAIILVALLVRCYFLLLRRAAATALVSLIAHTLGATIAVIIFFVFTTLTLLAYIHPEDGIGHRVGAEGFSDAVFENTVEALEELAAQDARGALDSAHFPFIEFDVQETKDCCLVLFHDTGLLRAFPDAGPNNNNHMNNINTAAWGALRTQGIDPLTATIQDLTVAQLDTLHLGGRKGVKVPTLKKFLEACVEYRVRRTLAVEVKHLITDRGREELLNLISWYKATRVASPGLDKLYAPLGSASIIAFPPQFVTSFGEFGSPQWHRWAGEFNKRGIKARCCHVHWLDYLQ